MNPAQSLLGPLYTLYVSALGQTVGMIVGYVTLVGITALVWWQIEMKLFLVWIYAWQQLEICFSSYFLVLFCIQ